MTDFETVMWILDGDPRLSSAFANLTILDRPPERTGLRHRMSAATRVIPRLRQRVVEAAVTLSTPTWVEDPSFDLDRHIRWVDLGDDDLDEVVASLAARPFDRERPLWEFVVIEGLPDGRAAMLQRFDHTITDGVGGIRLSTQFLDLERHPDPRPPVGGDAAGQGGRDAAGHPAGAPVDEPVDASTDPVSRAVDGLRGITSASGAAIRSVTTIPTRTAGLLDTVLEGFQQLALDGRRSPLWTDRSTQRWFGRSAVHLGDVKDAAHALGGTVNDFFVTGALSAAAQMHIEAGLPTEELRVAIPINKRSDRSAGGNAFTPAHTLLPAGDMPVEERFLAVHDRVGAVKRGQGSVSIDTAAAAVRHLPASALIGFAARTAGAVDFVCSNVRAAPFDLFIAGAHLEGNYPVGPLVNTAFNLTTMSYRGWLFLGLSVDPVAVVEPGHLLAALDDSYDTLLAAGGVSRRRSVRGHPGIEPGQQRTHVEQKVRDLRRGDDRAL